MTKWTNYAGYVHYSNEQELCQELENNYFQTFFDVPWQPIENNTKEVWLDNGSRIDYVGFKNDTPCYVEVKNWFVSDKDMLQILRYSDLIRQKHGDFYSFYVICGGIDGDKLQVLHDECERLEVILTRDIKELNSVVSVGHGHVLVEWM